MIQKNLMKPDLCRQCLFSDNGLEILKDGWTGQIIRTNIIRRCFNKQNKKQYLRAVLIVKTMCNYFANETIDLNRKSNFVSYLTAKTEMMEVRKKMVKLNSEVAESKEPLEGQTYTIKNAEMIKTNVQQYNGLRVEMTDIKEDQIKEKQKYATMLWMRDEASQNSKLGSFLQVFKDFYDGKTIKDKKGIETQIDYQDTENWLNHTIKFVKWQNKSREIKIVE